MTSGEACHHLLWAAHTVERRRVWHALGRQTWSDDVRGDMPSPPLDSTHGRTSSSVAFHHCLWAAHTVKRRPAWHHITTFGQHTQSNDVGRWMPSLPLSSTNSRAMLGFACHHRPWTARTVGRRQAWTAITALEKHTRSNDVGHGMTSPPLDSTHV